MTKEELKAKIVTLELAIEKSKSDTCNVISELDKCKEELADINKPIATKSFLIEIETAIDNVIGDFNFNDADKYNAEFSLDYDGRVQLEHIELEDCYNLSQEITESVCNLFKEVEDEDNTSDNS